jgi:hypothetical protein
MSDEKKRIFVSINRRFCDMIIERLNRAIIYTDWFESLLHFSQEVQIRFEFILPISVATINAHLKEYAIKFANMINNYYKEKEYNIISNLTIQNVSLTRNNNKPYAIRIMIRWIMFRPDPRFAFLIDSR